MSGTFKAMKLAVVATGKSYSILSDAMDREQRGGCLCLPFNGK